MIDLKFWRGKKVLVTGHTGFKGAWLTLLLHELGSEIYGISHEAGCSESFYSEVIMNRSLIQEHWVDIRNFKELSTVICEINPNIIFHFAAQSQVKVGYQSPTLTYETNAVGTANMIEAIRDLKNLNGMIVATSDKVYARNALSQPSTETDALAGTDPYSLSKVLTELVIQNFKDSYPEYGNYKKIGIIRAGNVVGGGDQASYRLIPDIFRSVSENRVFKLRMPHAIRPWQHVLDCLSGYILLAEKISTGEIKSEEAIFNIGPNAKNSLSVLALINLIQESVYRMHKTDINFEIEALHSYELNKLELNSSKAAKMLQWESIFEIDEVVRLTSQWYLAQYKKEELLDLSLSQISLLIERCSSVN